MLDYHIFARRTDSHGAQAITKNATITLDTDMAGRADAFNPAEILLAGATELTGTIRRKG